MAEGTAKQKGLQVFLFELHNQSYIKAFAYMMTLFVSLIKTTVP